MKPKRSLVGRLSKQRAVMGLLQSHHNSVFAEMAGMCGYDFLLLDGEHGVFGERDILQTLQISASTDLLVLVRLADHHPLSVGRYLDMGADGIVVPNVSTCEQARMLVRSMEYPPAGTRGSGAALHRATRYGMDIAQHLKTPKEGQCLLVIIESALGVNNVGDILAVDGVEGVIIGPWDLSADLGCPGDFSRPQYVQAVEHIGRAAAERGKLLGTVPHGEWGPEALVARGHRLLILGADVSLLRQAMSEQIARARACL
jgi:4-hydroxy-2-oxoheptanedioate aldolase